MIIVWIILIVPPLAVRFLEWLLTQPSSFYSETILAGNGSGHGLWATICNSLLSLSTTQRQSLMVLRQEVIAQRQLAEQQRMTATLAAIHGMNGNTSNDTQPSSSSSSSSSNGAGNGKGGMGTWLSSTCARLAALARLHAQHSHRNMASLAAILTPLQLAHLLAWIDQYGAICIEINV
jgi:hypothetical protein